MSKSKEQIMAVKPAYTRSPLSLASICIGPSSTHKAKVGNLLIQAAQNPFCDDSASQITTPYDALIAPHLCYPACKLLNFPVIQGEDLFLFSNLTAHIKDLGSNSLVHADLNQTDGANELKLNQTLTLPLASIR